MALDEGTRDAAHAAEARWPHGGLTVFVTLLVGYAAFYFCRANVDAALPYLAAEFHYDKAKIGTVTSIAILGYAVGKIVLGAATEAVGGRRMFLFALFGSVFASLAIGVTPAFLGVAVLICLNRFVQSGGWSGVVDVASRWYPRATYGTVMGGLATSYEIGNVVALLVCSAVAYRFGWRALFLVNPLLLAIVGAVAFFTLRDAPARELIAAGVKPSAPKHDPRLVLRALLKKRALWYALVLSFVLTFVRTGFLTWTPTFLAEIAKGEANAVPTAIAKSAVFPAAGMIGAVVVGRLSDRLGPGRRAPAMATSLALLVLSVLLLAHAGVGSSRLALVAVGACGLFLLGPYSLLSGAVSLDVAEDGGAAAAAGLVDGVGYLGASLSGVVIGTLAERGGWAAAFDAVAVMSAIALAITLVWAREARADIARDTPEAS
jgi:sugar phosphate permease